MRILEWFIAVFSALALLFLTGFLAYDGLWGGKDEVALSLSHSPAPATMDGHRLNVRVENLGGRTASQVEVVGELRRDAQIIESAHFVIDYVPGYSHRGGSLVFRTKPDEATLSVRVSGFTVP